MPVRVDPPCLANTVSRQASALEFQFSFVTACLSREREDIRAALLRWRQLNSEQQYVWRESYLTVAALAATIYPSLAPLNWRGEFDQFVQLRNGELSPWVRIVVLRSGRDWAFDDKPWRLS